jgi:ABC-type nitrate/sulfonate/bicarbonate transport system substrate-binding protein
MKLPHRRQFLHPAAGVAVLPALTRIASAIALPAFARAQGLRIVLAVFSLLPIATNSPALSQTTTAIVFPEAIGSWLTPMFVAQEQGMFRTRNIDVSLVAASGASVPRVKDNIPFGLVGGPAALIQAAHGTDLKLIASFSKVSLRGKLVARPGIATPTDLRGKRVGVRVVGAGIWIQTVLALKQLQLDPKTDNIETVAIGGPSEILQALEAGIIDAALLPERQSTSLEAKGYTVLLDQYPPDLDVYENGMIVTSSYLNAHREVVTGVLDAIIEGVKFVHDPRNKDAVLPALALALKLPNGPAVEQRYSELKDIPEKPYPSIETLKKMQTLMSYHDPAVLNVRVEDLVDERLLNGLLGVKQKVR